MYFASWLRTLKSRSRPQRRPARRLRRPMAKLCLEILEDRSLPSTFFVTNAGDNGGVNPTPGAGTATLPQAIVDANADTATLSTINLNISPSGMQTINPSVALPVITHPVIIDGTTQPGWPANSLPPTGAP